MIEKPLEKRQFSLLEILAYLLVISILFLAIFFFFRGLQVQIRDRQRIENVKILEQALENYFQENKKYPQVSEWQCLEKDAQLKGAFWQEMKHYIQEIPQDPFYDPANPIFCYHYKTADGGKEYKIYVTLEKRKKIYQVFSPRGKNIFTGKLGEATWFNSAWKFRKRIKIPKEKVAGDLENFPVLIYLKDENLAKRAKSDGTDILFTGSDGKTLLKREIEKYDSQTGELIVWVKVPSLSIIEDNEIYLYYGNPQAIQVNDKETWDENFLMVHHFKETFGTTTDATANGNDGIPEGGLEQGAEGKIFRGVKFDGRDDYLNLGNKESFYQVENLTFQIWVRPKGEKKAASSEVRGDKKEKIFGLEGAEYKKRGIFGWEGSDSGPWQLVTSLSETSFGIRDQKIISENPLELNQWNFVAGVIGEKQMTLFINGKETSIKISHRKEPLRREEKFAEIGRYYRESSIYQEKVWKSYTFSGILDEFRLSRVARPLAWLETSYQNQKDPSTFIETGEEELY
ncbi:DUF2341 domain-containing protein [bacterium]|nr:DUF2341 domain-containing protein [bacterium]